VGAIAPISSSEQRWALDSLDWARVRRDDDEEGERLFYLVAAASFMEITTDRYTSNLIDKFSGDDEITGWLAAHWLPEELQHGEALRKYVETAWPEFDWDGAYASFIDEFAAYCAGERLEPSRTREMASRCVVEMGTASFYTTLSRIARDPVLARLAHLIAQDEIRHYKHFYRYFRRYQAAERTGRGPIAAALWHRLSMIAGEDNEIAVKHVFAKRQPGRVFDRRAYRNIRRGSSALIRRHFPHRMCVQMLLRPLRLGRRVSHVATPVVEAMARRLVP
jgi:ferritin-like protein